MQILHNGTVEIGHRRGHARYRARRPVGHRRARRKPTPVSITSPGQNAEYTFTGTIGQHVAAELTGSTFGPACPAVALSLVRPDGTLLPGVASTCSASVFLDTETLDQTGTWTVLVDPQTTDTGSATLQAFTSTDQTGAILRNGTPVSVSLPTPGQNAARTFTGTRRPGRLGRDHRRRLRIRLPRRGARNGSPRRIAGLERHHLHR